MFYKWKRLARHLERNGTRAPAEVLEIAGHGHEFEQQGMSKLDWAAEMGGGNELAPTVGAYSVRKARMRVTPADGEPFEVERDFRFGNWGEAVPKAGARLDVVYDPGHHEKVMVAPPTAEEEAIRTANALSKADIGIQIGGQGKAGARPVTKEELEERTNSMDEQMGAAASMLEQAQQFTSGQAKPGQKGKKK